MKTLSEQNLGAGAQMPSTHWSVICQARQDGSTEAGLALDSLCRAYWYPLYAYLRRAGNSPQQAQDLTQGFFAHLLGRKGFEGVQPIEGMRFRSWLLTALRHYVRDEWRRTQAERRGGGVVFVPIETGDAEDRYQHEPPDPVDPARLFDRKWAMDLLQRVLVRLEEKYAAKGKQELFAALQPFVMGGDSPATHEEIARRLGMKSATVTVAAGRLRERYQALLRAEIAQTVSTREEIDDELRHLAAALGE